MSAVGCCAIFLNEDNVKSLLCKMRIKTEDSMEAKATHHLETHAIYQTESPPRGSKYRSDSSTMRHFVYPFDVEERVHVCLKCTDGCHAKSMLYQSKSLNQDIIAAGHDFIMCDEMFPRPFCPGVFCIVSVQYGEKS